MAAKDFRKYGPVASWLMKIPGFELAKKAVPRGLVTGVKNVTTRPRRLEAVWEPAVLRTVADAFREDAAALLEHCGKPPDFWDLDGPPVKRR